MNIIQIKHNDMYRLYLSIFKNCIACRTKVGSYKFDRLRGSLHTDRRDTIVEIGTF